MNSHTVLFIFISAVFCGTALGVCPAGWISSKAVAGKCYFFSRDNATMPEAQEFCEMLGKRYKRASSLVTIENNAVQSEITALMNATGCRNFFSSDNGLGCNFQATRPYVDGCTRFDWLNLYVRPTAEMRDKTKVSTYLGWDVKSSQGSDAFWIGAEDIVQEGVFEWIGTGQTITYANWGPFNPNNRWGSENCVCLRYMPEQGYIYTWTDDPCSDRYDFICEMLETMPNGPVIG